MKRYWYTYKYDSMPDDWAEADDGEWVKADEALAEVERLRAELSQEREAHRMTVSASSSETERLRAYCLSNEPGMLRSELERERMMAVVANAEVERLRSELSSEVERLLFESERWKGLAHEARASSSGYQGQVTELKAVVELLRAEVAELARREGK